jgi:hypothetical protein
MGVSFYLPAARRKETNTDQYQKEYKRYWELNDARRNRMELFLTERSSNGTESGVVRCYWRCTAFSVPFVTTSQHAQATVTCQAVNARKCKDNLLLTYILQYLSQYFTGRHNVHVVKTSVLFIKIRGLILPYLIINWSIYSFIYSWFNDVNSWNYTVEW